SDLPSGWRSVPYDETSGDKTRAGISECRRYDAALRMERAQAHAGSEFADSSSGYVLDGVAVFSTPKLAKRYIAAMRDKSVPTCLSKIATAAAAANLAKSGSSATIGDVQAGELSVDPRGDEQVAYEVVLPATLRGTTASLYEDVQFVRNGRAVAQ